MDNAAEIQGAYIDELRSLLPAVMDWWQERLEQEDPKEVYRRWPTGPAGHPRVLHIFRKYFLQIEELNRRTEEFYREDSSPTNLMWGVEDVGPSAPLERPVDWLIRDIPTAAPDLADLVEGICFVPIGHTPDDEAV